MNQKLVSLFQREAVMRLGAAEYELATFTRACRGTVVDLNEMNQIRYLRDRVDRCRTRQLRWTRYRFLVESGSS